MRHLPAHPVARMSPLVQLLVGLVVLGIGLWLLFALLWTREIDRHEQTRASRDMARLRLALMARSDLGDALVSVTPARLRLSDEQRQMDALREADHYEMQRTLK
jgi:hypothetical protein